MKIIKTLDKNFCLDIISKYTDVLKEERERLDNSLKDVICVICKSNNIRTAPVFIKRELKEIPLFDGYLPKQRAICNDCNSEFDPITNLVSKIGEISYKNK